MSGHIWLIFAFIFVCPLGSTGFETHKQEETGKLEDSSNNFEEFIRGELDFDNDGLVSKPEMINKIEKAFKQQRKSEIDELLKERDLNNDNKISWNEFFSTSYPEDMSRYSDEDVNYDKKKFQMADADDDGFLDSNEFTSFYFPTVGNDNLIEWLMSDWLKKVDLNDDSFVTINEFLASHSEGNLDVQTQRKLRQHFHDDYDINKDGKIDKNELREWLVPNRASARKQAAKILKAGDDNGDGSLSVDEIIKNNESVLPLFKNTNSIYQEKDEL